jgi:hypothetical protein
MQIVRDDSCEVISVFLCFFILVFFSLAFIGILSL